MPMIYLVNPKTRMCQIITGGAEHIARERADAKADGFIEVTADEQEAFRADTRKALDAGWNPDGRTSYAKFVAKNQPQPARSER